MLLRSYNPLMMFSVLGILFVSNANAQTQPNKCPSSSALEKHGKYKVVKNNCTPGANNISVCNVYIDFSYVDSNQNLYKTKLNDALGIGAPPLGIAKIRSAGNESSGTCIYDFNISGVIDVRRSPNQNSKWFQNVELKIVKTSSLGTPGTR
jgi:hypothetical protein